MDKLIIVAAALAFTATASFAQTSPFAALKGKTKPGLYDYKMEMEMPGMPAGQAMPPMKVQNCVTDADLEKGTAFNRSGDGKKAPDCDVKDFKMSGNTASYKMVCKGANPMEADSTITFIPDGYKGTTKMTMDHGGQKMSMSSKFEAKYLGPCTK
jgi:hypothetical protein